MDAVLDAARAFGGRLRRFLIKLLRRVFLFLRALDDADLRRCPDKFPRNRYARSASADYAEVAVDLVLIG